MRFFFVCSRPAVSTSSVRTPRAFAAESASKSTAEGSAPSRWRTIGRSRRSAQVCSCSIAPARKVSAAASSTRAPGRLLPGRDLRGRRGLAGPVDADEEHEAQRDLGGRRRTRRRGQELLDFLEQDHAQGREVLALRPARPRAHGVGQRRGRLRAHVRGDQGLLERLEHRLVEPEALLDRGPELVEDLGVGHEEPALDLREEAAARARLRGARRFWGRRSWRKGKIPQTARRDPARGTY